jgi:hypothetical protein
MPCLTESERWAEESDPVANREKGAGKVGERCRVTGRKVPGNRKRPPVRMNAGGRPYQCWHPPTCLRAGALFRFLYLWSLFPWIVEPTSVFLHLPLVRMVAFTEAVKIALGRIAFRSAIHHQDRNRYETKSQPAFQGLV